MDIKLYLYLAGKKYTHLQYKHNESTGLKILINN